MSQEYQDTQFQTGSEPSGDGFNPSFVYAQGYQEYEKIFPHNGDMPPAGAAAPRFAPGQQQQAPFYAYVYPVAPPPGFAVGPDAGERLGGAASYALGWFSALIFLLFVPRNRFVRYHAWQSVVFFGLINIADIVALIGAHSDFMFRPAEGLAFLFFLFLNAIAGIAWCVGIIGALCGKYVTLPFVSGIAEQHSRGTQTIHP